jgi:CRISPR system Cascade subunit CasE
MTLHLIRLRPDMTRLMRWAAQQRVLPDDEDEAGYALHAVLAATFGTLRPQPFALVREPEQPPVLLAYSAHAAAALMAQAATADPDAAAAIGLAGLADKLMPERFAAGRGLGFAVRVRPTVRTDRDGNRDKVREVDAWLAALRELPPDAGPSRAEVYAGWLRERFAAGGAAAEHLTLDSFRLAPVHRRNAKRGLHRVRGPVASFRGRLVVRDPDRFAALLARGVGRHRAFGFGMLLLRPG